MKRHRIILVRKGLFQHYVVEYRWLFIFWIPYYDSNEHEIRFTTIKNAERFAEIQSTPKKYSQESDDWQRRVIKYL